MTTFDLPHNQWGPIYADLVEQTRECTLEELDAALAKAWDTDPLRALWLESIIGKRRRKEAWRAATRPERKQWREDERKSILDGVTRR